MKLKAVLFCTSIAQVTVGACVGLEKNDYSNSITLFPNPTKGTFQVKSGKSLKGEWLEVYDLPGNLLFKEKQVSDDNFISLEKYDAGIYQVRLITPSKTYYFKIIKE